MSDKPGQIVIIHSMRGLAALSVSLYHFVVTTAGFISNEAILGVFQYGSKGVQLFFIISGIVIPLSLIKSRYKIKAVGKFLLRRFIRIEPPYLLAVVIGIIYLYARNLVPNATPIDLTPSVVEVLLHIGYLIPFFEAYEWINPVFWTLSIEFQYYLFLALFFPLVLSNKKALAWIFNMAILVMPLLIDGNAFFPQWASYFGLGIFYALYITDTYTLREFITLMLLCCIVVYFQQGLVDLAIALMTLVLVHVIPDFANRTGEFLGKISYSMYLLHTVVGATFINFMSRTVTSPGGKFCVILAGLILSLASAYLFWMVVERPSQIKAREVTITD